MMASVLAPVQLLQAEPTIDSMEELRIPEGKVQTQVLPNGLTVIVKEDRSAPVASVQAWCATGSIHEGEHLGAGLSHILEHMLFKGTEERDVNQITQSIQDLGGYINAYTSFDRTVYWVEVPSEGVRESLEILADSMMNSTLPEEEYIKEQEVIRREFAMGRDDPNRMSTLLLFGTAYQVHPYREPVIGHLEIYNQLTRDQVLEYYHARYAPNNLAFVVVGDVDAEEVFSVLQEFFDAHPRRSVAPVFIPEEPRQVGPRERHVEFSTELTRMGMAWHTVNILHQDAPALDVLAMVLGQGRSSRLYRKVQDDLGLVHSVGSGSFTPQEPGLFMVRAVLDPGNRNDAREAILEVIRELQEEGITAEELAKAQRQSISGRVSDLTTTRGQASDLGLNWLYTGSVGFTQEYMEALLAVTEEDVREVARKYLHGSNMTVTSLNPIGSLEEEQAVAEVQEAGEIQKFELSNGLRLLVREDRRLPLVNMTAVFRGGVLAETAETNGLTELFSRMLLRGAGDRSAAELAEVVESVGGQIDTNSGNNSFGVTLEVLQPDLALGMEVLADVLLRPRLPEEDLDREKARQIASIKAEQDQMIARTRNLLRSNLFQDHPYALSAIGNEESVQNLAIEQLAGFAEEYVTANNGVLAVFGDVSAEEVKQLAEAALSKMPVGEPVLEEVARPAEKEESLRVVEFVDRNQAVLMVGFPGVDIYNPDRFAMDLIDQALSELGSRLATRIREEMGLAYFIGTSQLLGLAPGMFFFYVGTDPERVEEVEKEMLKQIELLGQEGLGAEELERARKKFLGRMKIRNQSNAALAFTTALDELYGLGYNHYLEVPEIIEGITMEDIQRVAAEYFRDQPFVTALVKPEVNPEQEAEE